MRIPWMKRYVPTAKCGIGDVKKGFLKAWEQRVVAGFLLDLGCATNARFNPCMAPDL